MSIAETAVAPTSDQVDTELKRDFVIYQAICSHSINVIAHSAITEVGRRTELRHRNVQRTMF